MLCIPWQCRTCYERVHPNQIESFRSWGKTRNYFPFKHQKPITYCWQWTDFQLGTIFPWIISLSCFCLTHLWISLSLYVVHCFQTLLSIIPLRQKENMDVILRFPPYFKPFVSPREDCFLEQILFPFFATDFWDKYLIENGSRKSSNETKHRAVGGGLICLFYSVLSELGRYNALNVFPYNCLWTKEIINNFWLLLLYFLNLWKCIKKSQ